MLPYCDFDEQVDGLDRRRTAASRSDRPSPRGEGRDRRRQGPAARRATSTPARRRTTAERTRHLESHARQVREHMVEAQRQELLGSSSVTRRATCVMFLPDEGVSFAPPAGARSRPLSRRRPVPRARRLRPRHSSSSSSRSRTAGSRRASQRTRARSLALGRRALRACRHRGRSSDEDGKQPQGGGRGIQRHGRIAREAAPSDRAASSRATSSPTRTAGARPGREQPSGRRESRAGRARRARRANGSERRVADRQRVRQTEPGSEATLQGSSRAGYPLLRMPSLR